MRRFFALFVMLAASLAAADVTGKWDFEVQLDAGSGVATLTLKRDGETLTGKYNGQFGEAPLKGTLKGSDFYVTFEVMGAKVEYTGKVETDKKIKGKAKYGDQASGTFEASRK